MKTSTVQRFSRQMMIDRLVGWLGFGPLKLQVRITLDDVMDDLAIGGGR